MNLDNQKLASVRRQKTILNEMLKYAVGKDKKRIEDKLEVLHEEENHLLKEMDVI